MLVDPKPPVENILESLMVWLPSTNLCISLAIYGVLRLLKLIYIINATLTYNNLSVS